MKIVLRIFGIISILIAVLFCALSVHRAGLDKEDAVTELAEANALLAKYKTDAAAIGGEAETYMKEQVAGAEKQIAEAPSGSTYTILQVLLSAMLVLALVFGVMLFRTSVPRSQQLLLLAVALLLAAYFLSPDIKRGPYGGMESRTLALMSGIPVIVAGLFALLVAKRNIAIK